MTATYRQHAAARDNLRQQHYPAATVARPARRIELTPIPDALPMDGADAADITIEENDRVTFHSDEGDFEARVLTVSPPCGFVPERYHLQVYAGSDFLQWVQCFRERVTLRIKASALEAARATSAS